MTYPAWSYFPSNVRPPAWAVSFVEVVRAAEAKISTVEHRTGLSSDDVLKELGPGLVALGYAVESGKTKAAKIFRPVLFVKTELRRSTTRSMRFTISWASLWRSKRAAGRQEMQITATSSGLR